MGNPEYPLEIGGTLNTLEILSSGVRIIEAKFDSPEAKDAAEAVITSLGINTIGRSGGFTTSFISEPLHPIEFDQKKGFLKVGTELALSDIIQLTVDSNSADQVDGVRIFERHFFPAQPLDEPREFNLYRINYKGESFHVVANEVVIRFDVNRGEEKEELEGFEGAVFMDEEVIIPVTLDGFVELSSSEEPSQNKPFEYQLPSNMLLGQEIPFSFSSQVVLEFREQTGNYIRTTRFEISNCGVAFETISIEPVELNPPVISNNNGST